MKLGDSINNPLGIITMALEEVRECETVKDAESELVLVETQVKRLHVAVSEFSQFKQYANASCICSIEDKHEALTKG
jgi:hypothetical protein